MGVPTSEVGYITAMPRREDHEVHKDMWWHWIKKKVNVYLPSLRMKVPDHVYVFGSLLLQLQLTFQSVLFIVFCLLLLSNGINVGIGHTCNKMRVYHDTIITCSTADSFCSLFPYPLQPALPHMCLRNAHEE
jgi:hypothetical protein